MTKSLDVSPNKLSIVTEKEKEKEVLLKRFSNNTSIEDIDKKFESISDEEKIVFLEEILNLLKKFNNMAIEIDDPILNNELLNSMNLIKLSDIPMVEGVVAITKKEGLKLKILKLEQLFDYLLSKYLEKILSDFEKNNNLTIERENLYGIGNTSLEKRILFLKFIKRVEKKLSDPNFINLLKESNINIFKFIIKNGLDIDIMESGNKINKEYNKKNTKIQLMLLKNQNKIEG